ncbi:hypothetical protein JCM14469_33060 [Desulfatiferula olefinivorans]
MNYLLCIDDTDQLDGPGTGHLLQALCETLAVRGWCGSSPISRHQLFVHEAIPYTSHNSSLCSALSVTHDNVEDLIDFCGRFLEEKSAPGSDPGLCLVRRDINDRQRLIDFGNRAKWSVLTKDDAYKLARDLKIHLSEHGGTGQGVVGALAGAGLHLSGEDGRFRGWYHLGREGSSFYVKDLVAYPFIDSIQSESGEVLSEDTLVRLGGDELKLILKNGRQVLPVTRTPSGWKTLTKKEVKKY